MTQPTLIGSHVRTACRYRRPWIITRPSMHVAMSDSSSHTVALPADKSPELRVIPMPADANMYGDVFGGWIMAQVDLAGAIPAIRRARGRVATIAVNSFVFKQPVFVGDVLNFYADVVRVGRTSITVEVEVYAQRMDDVEQTVKVTEATLTYVATDNDRQPRAIPPAA
jgi:acyl-CoA thioesterase YciA